MAKREAGKNPKPKAAKAKRKSAKAKVDAASADSGLDDEIPAGGNYRPPSDKDRDAFLQFARRAETQSKAVDQAMKQVQKARSALSEIYVQARDAGVPADRLRMLKKVIKERKMDAAEILVDERERAFQHIAMKSALVEVLPFDMLMKPPSLKEIEMQGEHAGKNGEPNDNNPWTPGTAQFTAWAAGHKKGQRESAADVFQEDNPRDGGEGPRPVH